MCQQKTPYGKGNVLSLIAAFQLIISLPKVLMSYAMPAVCQLQLMKWMMNAICQAYHALIVLSIKQKASLPAIVSVKNRSH